MNSKLMAQIFSDIIAVAQMPKIINGEVYMEHRRNISVTDEMIEAMLFAQRELRCINVGFGSYDCYEQTIDDVSVDSCLVGEINRLNNEGITTIGCCCGHGKKQGYIQVTPSHIEKMISLGYKQLSVDEYGNGGWCFKPKTVLPVL